MDVQTFANQARSPFVAELLLARSIVALGAPDAAVVHHLTETKRFGIPLATYLYRGRPALRRRFRASVALRKTTAVGHIWNKAPCSTFWFKSNLGYFLGQPRASKMQHIDAWQVSTLVRNDGLLTAFAAHATLLLQTEAASRRASGLDFDRGELVLVVCAVVRRVVEPFGSPRARPCQTETCLHI